MGWAKASLTGRRAPTEKEVYSFTEETAKAWGNYDLGPRNETMHIR